MTVANNGDLIYQSFGSGEMETYSSSPGGQGEARFSSDGLWVAYYSDRSGRPQIHMQPFPGPGRAIQVSVDSGRYPIWSRDGNSLFYIERGFEDTEKTRMMVVDLATRTPTKIPSRGSFSRPICTSSNSTLAPRGAGFWSQPYPNAHRTITSS